MEKISAVDFLMNEIINGTMTLREAYNQSLEMEKKEIIDAYNQGWLQCNIYDLRERSREKFEDANDYYNKTFKSE